MSLDKEKPERVEVKLRGKPSTHLVKYRDHYYNVMAHSPKQAKMILSLKSRKKLGDDWQGVKNEMNKMKSG